MFIKILKKKSDFYSYFQKIFDYSINYPVKLHDFRRARVKLQIEERVDDIAEVHR